MSDFSRSSNPRTVWSHRGAMEEKHNVRTIQSPDRQDNAMTQQRPAYIRRMTGDSSSSSATRIDSISSTTIQPTNPLARLTLADGARDDVSPLSVIEHCHGVQCLSSRDAYDMGMCRVPSVWSSRMLASDYHWRVDVLQSLPTGSRITVS